MVFHVLYSGHTRLKNVCRMSAGVKLLTDAASPDASCRRRSRVRKISPFPLRIELKIASKMLPWLASSQEFSVRYGGYPRQPTLCLMVLLPIDDSTSALDHIQDVAQHVTNTRSTLVKLKRPLSKRGFRSLTSASDRRLDFHLRLHTIRR